MPALPPLCVVPNPYASLDDDGDPVGYVLRVDLRRLSSKPQMVGARRVMIAGKPKIAHESDVVELPDLPAYRQHLKAGAILPADEATARRAGLAWVPPEAALAAAKVAAAAKYLATFGVSPSWAAPAADLTPAAEATP